MAFSLLGYVHGYWLRARPIALLADHVRNAGPLHWVVSGWVATRFTEA